MLGIFVSLLGLCHDSNPKACNEWAASGHCHLNEGYMLRECPVACDMCHHECNDSDDQCMAWAKMGECKSNARFMLKTCPTTCGLCHHECIDTNDGITEVYESKRGPKTACEVWQEEDECEKNPEYMYAHCPKTCRICGIKCADLDWRCHHWAENGQCKSNPGFILKTCPRSCDICNEDTKNPCGNKRHMIDCTKWTDEGRCDSDPEFMLRNCALMCGLCKSVCKDHHPMCPTWAHNKTECDDNPAYMRKVCPQSCGFCARMFAKQQEFEPTRRSFKDEV